MSEDGYLGTRVLQLEYKLKAMAQRSRKEIIWRKQLEDWILKNFNYDLRLEVELKLLKSEGADSDDFECLENSLNSSTSNRIFMGQTSITKTRNLNVSAAGSQVSSTGSPGSRGNFVNNRNVGVGPSHNQSHATPMRHMPPNISITTMPVSSSMSQSQSQTLGGVIGVGGRGVGNIPPWPGVVAAPGIQQIRPVYKRRRIANNVGNRQMQRIPIRAPNNHGSTPIIVSTSSMAPKKLVPANYGPGQEPELILLDDDEDEKCRSGTAITPATTYSPSTPSFTSTLTTISAPAFSTTTSSSMNNFSVISSSGINSFGTFDGNNSRNNTCGINTGTCSTSISGGTSCCVNTNSGVINSGANISSTYNPSSFGVISSSSSLPLPTNPGANSSGFNAAGSYSATNVPTSFVNNDLSGTNSADNGPDSENSNGYDSSFQLMNMIQLESRYASTNYITRNDGILQFNVKKILLDFEPSLHAELLQANPVNLSLGYKKRINANVCHFLMQVYSANVPRTAKIGMADSLFAEFPNINKDEWYKKLPHKNATGYIENRINNLRKNMRDQQKRVLEQDSSSHLV